MRDEALEKERVRPRQSEIITSAGVRGAALEDELWDTTASIGLKQCKAYQRLGWRPRYQENEGCES
jgi:hypothetical protein